MKTIDTLDALEDLYGPSSKASQVKVVERLTPAYRDWIAASRFCILSTVGPDGTDGSPRGDDGPVVTVLDDQHFALPDWRGNNRIDSLRNIVRDPRVSVMFMVPGADIVVRVNGRAKLTTDEALCGRFDRDGNHPRSVTIVRVEEAYFQCARAIARARLWQGDDLRKDLPTAGDMLRDASSGSYDGAAFDKDWADPIAKIVW
ncbi:pyridoxamine 5'-phosphate oxidase family protein [Aliiroseovarius crassostreae]|uniref:pyridoxamine 5'-phosphate oxidase family protein n=1 Tax=Aliiroseovarius crassostreae TaxID=154981 RepID=UPI003C7A4EE3